MNEEIISHDEMCNREGTHLIRGINFNFGDMHSIILMSRTPDAPYNDEFIEEDTALIYEGHDVDKKPGIDPKMIDQPERTLTRKFTHNGEFHQAAQQFVAGDRSVEQVRVYEKIQDNVWVDHGVFFLVDSWIDHDGNRNVFKFKLIATFENQTNVKVGDDIPRRKVTSYKIMTKVLEQNGHRCYICGNRERLAFIHTDSNSITKDSVHIICDKH